MPLFRFLIPWLRPVVFVLPFLLSPASALAGSPPISLAVLTFDNTSPYPENDWVGAGFAETLSTKLGSLGSVRVLERRQLPAILKAIGMPPEGDASSDEALRKTANELSLHGAGHVIVGSVQSLGPYREERARLQVNVRCVKVVSGEIESRLSVGVRGVFGELFDLQVRLARTLLEKLKIPLTPEEEMALKKSETSSIEHYRLFIEGYRSLDRGDFTKAKKLFRKAYRSVSFPAAREGFAVACEKEIEQEETLTGEQAVEKRTLYHKEVSQQASAGIVGVYYLGRERIFAGEYDKAIECFLDFIKYNLNKVVLWETSVETQSRVWDRRERGEGFELAPPHVLYGGSRFDLETGLESPRKEGKPDEAIAHWPNAGKRVETEVRSGDWTVVVTDKGLGGVHRKTQKRWFLPHPVETGRFCAPVIRDGHVYTASMEKEMQRMNGEAFDLSVYCLTMDGAEAWKTEIFQSEEDIVSSGHSLLSPVALVGDVLVAHYSGAVYDENIVSAYDRSTGRLLWEKTWRKTGRLFTSDGTEGKGVVLSFPDKITCLDSTTGALKWEKHFESNGTARRHMARPVFSQGRIFSAAGNDLLVLDAGSGDTLTVFHAPDPIKAFDVHEHLAVLLTERPGSKKGRSEKTSRIMVVKPLAAEYQVGVSEVDAERNLGRAYAAKGQLTRAAAMYLEVHRKKANDLDALYELGMLYDRQGAPDKALEYLEAYVAGIGADGPKGTQAMEVVERLQERLAVDSVFYAGRLFLETKDVLVFRHVYDLIGVDAETGRRLWRYTWPKGVPHAGAVLENRLFIGAKDSRLIAGLHLLTGKPLWQTTLPERSPSREMEDAYFQRLRVPGARITIGGDHDAVIALPRVGPAGRLYVLTVRGHAFEREGAFSASVGFGVIWNIQPETGRVVRERTVPHLNCRPFLKADRRFLYAAADESLIAVSAGSFQPLWRIPYIGGSYLHSSGQGDQGWVPYVFWEDGVMKKVDPSRPGFRWEQTVDGRLEVSEAGGRVGFYGRGVYRFGERLSDPAGEAGVMSGDGKLFVPLDKQLVCLDEETGRPLWTRKRSAKETAYRFEDGRLLEVSPTSLARLNPDTGERVSGVTFEKETGPPLVVGEDGIFGSRGVAGASDGRERLRLPGAEVQGWFVRPERVSCLKAGVFLSWPAARFKPEGIAAALSPKKGEGLAALRRKLLLDPGDQTIRVELARALKGQGLMNQAVAVLAEGLETVPGDTNESLLITTFNAFCENPDLGEASYTYALRIRPDHGALEAGLLDFYLKGDRCREALSFGAQLEEKRPADLSLLKTLARVTRTCHEDQEANRIERSILSIDPRDDATRKRLVDRLIEQKNVEEASSLASEGALISPGFAESLPDCYSSFEASGKAEAYVSLVRRVLEKNPNAMALWAELITDLSGRGNTDLAVTLITVKCRKSPGFLWAAPGFWRMFEQAGRSAEFIRLAESTLGKTSFKALSTKEKRQAKTWLTAHGPVPLAQKLHSQAHDSPKERLWYVDFLVKRDLADPAVIVDHLTTLIQAFPTNDAIRTRAILYAAEHDRVGLAVEWLKAGCREDAGFFGNKRFAGILGRAGRVDLAYDLAAALVEADPGGWRVFDIVEQVCLMQGEPGKALPLLRKALAAEPQEPRLSQRHIQYLLKHELAPPETILALFQDHLRRFPKDASTRSKAITYAASVQNLESAVTWIEEGCRMDPGFYGDRGSAYAEILHRAGEKDLSWKLAQALFEEEPTSAQTYEVIAYVCEERGQVRDAIPFFERGLSEHSDDSAPSGAYVAFVEKHRLFPREEVLRLYDTHLTKFPKDRSTRSAAIKTASALDPLNFAVKWIEGGCRVDPGFLNYSGFTYAEILHRAGERALSWRLAQAMFEDEPTSTWTYKVLAYVCEERGQVREAIPFFEKGMSAHPDDPTPSRCYLEFMADHRLASPRRILDGFRSLLETHPKDRLVRRRAIASAHEAKEDALAIQWIVEGCEQDSGFFNDEKTLFPEILHSAGRPDLSWNLAQAMFEDEPTYRWSYAVMLFECWKRGDIETIEAYFQNGHVTASTYNSTAWHFLRKKDVPPELLNKALSLARRAHALDPGNRHILGTLCYALWKTQRSEEALPFIAKRVALDPSDPWAHYEKALILGALGRKEEARVSLQRAVELDPDNELRQEAERLPRCQ